MSDPNYEEGEGEGEWVTESLFLKQTRWSVFPNLLIVAEHALQKYK